ncbi:MAG: anti-sigma factor family protein, partial [Acidimicrobiia bacterium]
MSRHPSRQELGALFDGEERPGVATHLAGCARCQAWTGELRRVRALVRGEPVPAAAPAHLLRPTWAYPATAVALVVAILGVAGAAGLLSRDATTTLASRGMPPAVPSGNPPAPGTATEPAPGAEAHPPASG